MTNEPLPDSDAVGPTHLIPGDPPRPQLRDAMALCLSGGGYRAMLFHVGALWRLNEAGYLRRLDRISSVSGGSITAGVLALGWPQLRFGAEASPVADNFDEVLVQPIRRMAGKTIDEGAVIGGLLGPGSVADRVIRAYRKYLFGDATLQNLPDQPRFVFNATNVQSGVLWRFSKPYMADWRVGKVLSPTLSLATSVAASSAFPPVLSPVVIDLDPEQFEPGSGSDLTGSEYRDEVYLTDGGVYDNLGLETVWKRYRTVLVSDGGGRMEAEPEPKRDWARHTQRILSIIDRQVRSLRKRQVIDSYLDGQREGAYWGIWTDIRESGLQDVLECPVEKTAQLAQVPTRLERLDPLVQERLINWGYAICDCAVRSFYDRALPRGNFPYPAAGVG